MLSILLLLVPAPARMAIRAVGSRRSLSSISVRAEVLIDRLRITCSISRAGPRPMNHKPANTMKFPSIVLASALLAAAPSCTSLSADRETAVTAEPGVPGGEVVRTTTLRATVTGIDTTKRKVSLVTRYGEKFDVTAGPEVVNFDQIRIGDQLKVVSTENLLVRMAKPGETLADESFATADLARVGAKPAGKVTQTTQNVATVTHIDVRRRKATLQFSDGSTEKFDVRPDIDLTRHQAGEKVLIRSTGSLAVSMEKP